jgi:intron-binding protein aquarius
MKEVIKSFPKINFGFKYNIQFINVEEFNSKGEEINSNYSYYNLPEAEFSIGIYMYMCLVGYNPENITILCAYNPQSPIPMFNLCLSMKLFSQIN